MIWVFCDLGWVPIRVFSMSFMTDVQGFYKGVLRGGLFVGFALVGGVEGDL